MKFFVMSDIHIDFYIPNNAQSIEYNNVVDYFEKFYNDYMQSAENLIFPGDCANDIYNQINFYNFLKTKYQHIYVVFGNHDWVANGGTFGNGNPKYTEERIEQVKNEFKNDSQLHILDGNIINGIAGTIGMCDFHYETQLDLGIQYKINKWQKSWFDGRRWHIKSPEWHNGYKINPIAIWTSEKTKMINLAMQQPKVMVTHFCPLQLGIQKEYSESESTGFFYFDGKEILDIFDHETYWFCGHIHAMSHTDYINNKGQIIHIWALPQAYPFENPYVNVSFETKLDTETGKYINYQKDYNKDNRMFTLWE